MSKSTRSYSKPIAPSTNLIEDINQINKRLETSISNGENSEYI